MDVVERILIVDDDDLTAELYMAEIEAAGLGRPVVCTDSREVMTVVEEKEISLVLLDLHMPHIGGIELLSQMNEHAPHVTVIVITAIDRVDTAVECMKQGAFDFMSKPVDGPRLVTAVRHALRIRELEREVSTLSTHVGANELDNPDAFAAIVTRSPEMYRMFAYVEAIATSPKSVLIIGESGSGKELVARAVHELSGRTGRFVAVNVSGLDDAMVSDTLFGHEKGAYTGAASDRRGLIDQATDGTLFLDEIGDMAINAQLKLLRLLQEEEYYPLGSDVPRKARVRIVAATNADLDAKQRDGTFRRDLYYRLIAHTVRIPPLRDRRGDIPVLVDHFVHEAAESLDRQPPRVPESVYRGLERYRFPGNVRELQSLMYDALSTSRGDELDLSTIEARLGMTLGDGHGDDGVRVAASGEESEPSTRASAADREAADHPPIRIGSRFPTLEEVEDYLIDLAFRKSGGNQTHAARLLGVSQSTLSRRLQKRG